MCTRISTNEFNYGSGCSFPCKVLFVDAITPRNDIDSKSQEDL